MSPNRLPLTNDVSDKFQITPSFNFQQQSNQLVSQEDGSPRTTQSEVGVKKSVTATESEPTVGPGLLSRELPLPLPHITETQSMSE